MAKFLLMAQGTLAVVLLMLSRSVAEVVQPIMITDCENSTVPNAEVVMNYFADVVFNMLQPDASSYAPGDALPSFGSSNTAYPSDFPTISPGDLLGAPSSLPTIQPTPSTVNRRKLGGSEHATSKEKAPENAERKLISTCPRNCNSPSNRAICRALNCKGTGGGRRLQMQGTWEPPSTGFPLDQLVQQLNQNAGQVSITWGCQVTIFINQIQP